ncbi:MAG: DUF6880 family protein [Cyanobium sp.]
MASNSAAKGTPTAKGSPTAKGTPTAKQLEALGVERLAELVLELSEGKPAAKRVMRLALAEQQGPAELARQVRQRLATIARAGSLLDDDPRDDLLRELDRVLKSLSGPIVEHDAALALELLWDVLELSQGLIERCDASDGVVRDWFHQACAVLGQVACHAKGSRQALADQVLAAVLSNGCGQFDPIVRDLGPALGPEGLEHLRLRLESQRGRASTTVHAAAHRDLLVRIAMLDIADVLGDAVAYWAEYRDHAPEALTAPAIAAEVAQRLTAAGRAEDALSLLQGADSTLRQRRAGAEAWCDARLAALEALGRREEAQAQRWEFALLELSPRHLRDYLKRVPDFEDMVHEEKALDLVAEHDDLEEALWFFLEWPEPHRASRLVLNAAKPLNGDRYLLLAPLAELLQRPHPLAATRCLRAMIDSTLQAGRFKRYIYASRHLDTCHRLAPAINDWQALPDHTSYLTQLRRDHGRKHAFWSKVSKAVIASGEQPKLDAPGHAKGDQGASVKAQGSPSVTATGSEQPELW